MVYNPSSLGMRRGRSPIRKGKGLLDERATPVTQLELLVEFMDACRRATTMAEVNLAAGCAREQLLDLAVDSLDHLRDLFELGEDRP